MSVKISDLPSAEVPLSGDELVEVVRGGLSRRATTADLQSIPSGLSVSGSFAPLWSDFSADPPNDLQYHKAGNIVDVFVNSDNFGTSDSASFSFTGLPALLRPSGVRRGIGIMVDNGIRVEAAWAVFPNGLVNFAVGFTQFTGGWTAAGDKGLPEGWNIMYATS